MANGRTNQADALFERLWGTMRIEDATDSLIVVVNSRDIAKADPRDPHRCAFSLACRRLFQSQAAMFLRTTAYVDLPTEKGERVVKRFQISSAAKKLIQEFDKTGTAPEGGFLLRPVEPSKQLDVKVEYNRRYRDRKNERQALQIQDLVEKNPRAGLRPDPLTIEGVRHGTGMVAHRLKRKST